MTHKFIYPTISINYTGAVPGIYEEGQTINITKIVLNSSGGNIDAFKESLPEMYINGNKYDISNDIITSRDDQYIIEFAFPLSISTSTTILFNTLINNTIVPKSSSFIFTKAHYHGTVSNLDDLTDDYIINSNKKLSVKGNLTYKFTVEKGYTFLCYPKEWGTIKIVDQNGFNVTAGYTLSELTIKGNNYYLARVTVAGTVNNFGLTFSFS